MTAIDIHWDDHAYIYDADDHLTVGTMRQIKSWYPQIGTLWAFETAWQAGDPDALMCLLWLLRRRAGENAPEPRTGDLSLREFLNAMCRTDRMHCEKCGGWGWTGSSVADIDWDDKTYPYDVKADLTASAMRKVKEVYPEFGTTQAFSIGVLQGDPEALGALLWILRKKAGDTVTVADLRDPPDFSLRKIRDAVLNAERDVCEPCDGRGWFEREGSAPLVETPTPTSPTPAPTSPPPTDTSTET